MHLGWSIDDRPRWGVRIVYQVVAVGDWPGRPEANRLEREIAATGKARAPRVGFGGGEASIAMVVKGVDDLDAATTALTVLDSAARHVPRVAFGELLSSAVRADPATGSETGSP